MAKTFLIDAIIKLGDWNCSMEGEDLSTIKFFDSDGNEIAKPSDFPTDEQILTAQAEEQTRLDNLPNLKASAKTKLMAGEPLTEEEADVMIGG